MNGRRRNDQSHAGSIELCTVTNSYNLTRSLDHGPIDSRLEDVGRHDANFWIETIDRKKENVGVYLRQRIFGHRTDQREGVFAQRAAGENDLEICVAQLCCNIDGVRNDSKV